MAKEIEGYLKVQIRGGQANPSPPVGPALGSKGLILWSFASSLMQEPRKNKDSYCRF